jgi:hypothetical protein
MFVVQCVLHCMCVWGLKLRATVELPSTFFTPILYGAGKEDQVFDEVSGFF